MGDGGVCAAEASGPARRLAPVPEMSKTSASGKRASVVRVFRMNGAAWAARAETSPEKAIAPPAPTSPACAQTRPDPESPRSVDHSGDTIPPGCLKTSKIRSAACKIIRPDGKRQRPTRPGRVKPEAFPARMPPETTKPLRGFFGSLGGAALTAFRRSPFRRRLGLIKTGPQSKRSPPASPGIRWRA